MRECKQEEEVQAQNCIIMHQIPSQSSALRRKPVCSYLGSGHRKSRQLRIFTYPACHRWMAKKCYSPQRNSNSEIMGHTNCQQTPPPRLGGYAGI